MVFFFIYLSYFTLSIRFSCQFERLLYFNLFLIFIFCLPIGDETNKGHGQWTEVEERRKKRWKEKTENLVDECVKKERLIEQFIWNKNKKKEKY